MKQRCANVFAAAASERESGRIQPDGSARKLLYILKEKPVLMRELYRFEDEQDEGPACH